jgi:isoaspartyl peptidase/L-asparaginase-like protein (Ntn-hydrolase superfamily)
MIFRKMVGVARIELATPAMSTHAFSTETGKTRPFPVRRIGGAIGIRKDGQIGWAHNSPMFAVALITSEMHEAEIYLKKDEGR